MIALFGAPIVRCAKYAPAGTKELAGLTLEALDQSHAVLLSNYCALTTGATLEAALVRARELETLARLYAIALSLGRPAILADEEVGRIGERLKSNGAESRPASRRLLKPGRNPRRLPRPSASRASAAHKKHDADAQCAEAGNSLSPSCARR